MERRKFTREFKLEAVRLIKDRGVSYVQASQDLRVHVSQLRFGFMCGGQLMRSPAACHRL
jgi:transposase-like protein